MMFPDYTKPYYLILLDKDRSIERPYSATLMSTSLLTIKGHQPALKRPIPKAFGREPSSVKKISPCIRQLL